MLLQVRHAGLTSLPYAQMITGPACSATRGGTPPPGGGKSMWLLLALCLVGSGLPCVPLLGFWAGLPWGPLRVAGGLHVQGTSLLLALTGLHVDQGTSLGI